LKNDDRLFVRRIFFVGVEEGRAGLSQEWGRELIINTRMAAADALKGVDSPVRKKEFFGVQTVGRAGGEKGLVKIAEDGQGGLLWRGGFGKKGRGRKGLGLSQLRQNEIKGE